MQYIDLKEVSRRMGVPCRTFTVPDGRTLEDFTWAGKDFQTALAEVKAELAKGEPLAITESPAPWVTVGLIAGVKPAQLSYIYPNPQIGSALPMQPLAWGTPAENYDVQFEIHEEPDRILINMTADDPAKKTENSGPHTFKLENLEKVQVPPVTPGKDVYIHAWGMFAVMCNVALTYVQTARSVWIACHEGDYVCAYSTADTFAPGDVTIRTLENTLPH